MESVSEPTVADIKAVQKLVIGAESMAEYKIPEK
jgi:hypothetical protein